MLSWLGGTMNGWPVVVAVRINSSGRFSSVGGVGKEYGGYATSGVRYM